MDKKKVRVLKYQDHPELENKVVECVIMNNENIKSRMKKTIVPRKPKQPRMTINQLAGIVGQQGTKLDQLAGIVGQQGTKLDQLAITVNQLAVTVNSLALEMRAGFAAVNHRMDVEFAAINQRIDNIEDVLKRNNLK
jgi:outer membrane murein-binding lipoprotein Lpp